jgi:hypothetical protein
VIAFSSAGTDEETAASSLWAPDDHQCHSFQASGRFPAWVGAKDLFQAGLAESFHGAI